MRKVARLMSYALIAVVVLAVSACAGRDAVRELGFGIAERYCQAEEAERAVLRAQWDRGYGPVYQVNCEALGAARP